MTVSENLYYTILGLSGGLAFISGLLFGRSSMARIEKEMRIDGHARPAHWDGVGMRMMWYAYIYGLPEGIFNPKKDPLVNASLIRRYGKVRDRILAQTLLLTAHFTLIWVLLEPLVFEVHG